MDNFEICDKSSTLVTMFFDRSKLYFAFIVEGHSNSDCAAKSVSILKMEFRGGIV